MFRCSSNLLYMSKTTESIGKRKWNGLDKKEGGVKELVDSWRK